MKQHIIYFLRGLLIVCSAICPVAIIAMILCTNIGLLTVVILLIIGGIYLLGKELF